MLARVEGVVEEFCWDGSQVSAIIGVGFEDLFEGVNCLMIDGRG